MENGIMLSMRVCSSKPAILIEFNDVDINNLAGYEERRTLYDPIYLYKSKSILRRNKKNCCQPYTSNHLCHLHRQPC